MIQDDMNGHTTQNILTLKIILRGNFIFEKKNTRDKLCILRRIANVLRCFYRDNTIFDKEECGEGLIKAASPTKTLRIIQRSIQKNF